MPLHAMSVELLSTLSGLNICKSTISLLNGLKQSERCITFLLYYRLRLIKIMIVVLAFVFFRFLECHFDNVLFVVFAPLRLFYYYITYYFS